MELRLQVGSISPHDSLRDGQVAPPKELSSAFLGAQMKDWL